MAPGVVNVVVALITISTLATLAIRNRRKGWKRDRPVDLLALAEALRNAGARTSALPQPMSTTELANALSDVSAKTKAPYPVQTSPVEDEVVLESPIHSPQTTRSM